MSDCRHKLPSQASQFSSDVPNCDGILHNGEFVLPIGSSKKPVSLEVQRLLIIDEKRVAEIESEVKNMNSLLEDNEEHYYSEDYFSLSFKSRPIFFTSLRNENF